MREIHSNRCKEAGKMEEIVSERRKRKWLPFHDLRKVLGGDQTVDSSQGGSQRRSSRGRRVGAPHTLFSAEEGRGSLLK